MYVAGYAGENGNAKEPGSVGYVGRGAQHLLATGNVEGEHVDAQRGGGCNGFGDGVRDVVKFQVEKALPALFVDELDDARAGTGEELAADFEDLHVVAELPDEIGGAVVAVYIERHDKL